jgi:pyrimidine deaminase RibD-like protein
VYLLVKFNSAGLTPQESDAEACDFVQVVVGVGDPNPLVNNAGIQTLLQAGIQVAMVGGQEEKDCYSINQEFMERIAGTASSKP